MNTLVADIGIDTRKANNFATNQEDILNAITTRNYLYPEWI